MNGFEEYYEEATEPGKRERAYAWSTAIGLQDVDGLKPSEYLIKTAKRHIEGEITQEEARKIVDEYYETKEGHDLPRDIEEADKVSTRMVAIINSPTFSFSPVYYLDLHARLFDGVFAHAGKIREVELSKKEWVLEGASVQYSPSCVIEKELEYEFNKEAKFSYKGLSEDAFAEHFADFISQIWQIHPFREGNTRTAALFAIKYLRSKGYTATNDLFKDKSWYFRNALVRANYEDTKRGIEKELLYLAEFFKVLLFDAEIELKNRHLRLGYEYGSASGESLKGIHRENVVANVGVNVVVKLSTIEHKARELIINDGHISAVKLAQALGITSRQAQRIFAALKSKAGLKRRGSDKNGTWYFEKI